MGKSERSRHHYASAYPYPPTQRLQHSRALNDRQTVSAGFAAEHAFQLGPPWKQPELKRLQFVGDCGQYYSALLSQAYASTRKHLPARLQTPVAAVEARVMSLGSPLLDTVQTSSHKLLRQVDNRVDGLCLAAGHFLWPKVWQQRLTAAKANPRDEPNLALATWDTFASGPTVAKLVEGFEGVHASVVGSPSYRRAVHNAGEAVASVQQSALYRLAAAQLYPYIARYADPVLDQLAHSPLAQHLVQQMAPTDGRP